MITRKDYMEGRATYEAYYSEIVKECGVRVGEHLMVQVRKSTDPHLNDVPLMQWGSLHGYSARVNLAMAARGDYLTLAGAVCVEKQAAKMQLEAEKK